MLLEELYQIVLRRLISQKPRPYAAVRDGNGMVEAGGVEPPSEKARREETTCVAGSKFSATALEPARAAAA